MNDTILSLSDVSKTFRDFWGRPTVKAVTSLSCSVQRGEVFGLLGPNGSGKSTTIRMLLGLLKADSGAISVFGHTPDSPKARQAIGYLPEITYLHPFLTPRETLRYYGRLSGIPSATLEGRIDDLLNLVGLKHAANRRVGAFSKGMTRRVGLAQALLNAPQLLILDEPTSGLDPVGTREVKDLILALKQRGIAVLMSSHLLGDVQACADRVLILERGITRAQGDIHTLKGTLEDFFLKAISTEDQEHPLDAAGGLAWLGHQHV
ncbi:MAG: ABC transporter ATP-binding protein [Kiritimatiellae bacterium]|nr:ABC transporter ATP-binding protein [Kiritimatiellia bacterium]